MGAPSLFVASKEGFVAGDPLRGDEGETPVQIVSLEELSPRVDTPVATSPRGRFVTLGDAVDQSGDVRDALLALSPDPTVARWTRLRTLALGAPVAWLMYVGLDADRVSRGAKASRDAFEAKLADPDVQEAIKDPALAQKVEETRARIESSIRFGYANVAWEGLIGLAAAVIVIAGWRRFRPIAAAVGLAGGLFWLHQATALCFKDRAWRYLVLALFGVVGLVATLVLAPSEMKIAERLRARLRLPPSVGTASGPLLSGERRMDVVAALGAIAIGWLLPFLYQLVVKLIRGPSGDKIGAALFVFLCTGAFLGFLAFRRDRTRVQPRLHMLALIAVLGFGCTVAANVGVNAAWESVVDVSTCYAPPEQSDALKKADKTGQKETSNARHNSQESLFALLAALLAAPVAEEMLYRGTIQRLARRAFGARASILISGLVFGLAHLGAYQIAFYQTIGLGLAFAATFELAGGGAIAIVATACTHAMWNAWLVSMPN